jgi:hypothetical protein
MLWLVVYSPCLCLHLCLSTLTWLSMASCSRKLCIRDAFFRGNVYCTANSTNLSRFQKLGVDCETRPGISSRACTDRWFLTLYVIFRKGGYLAQ